MSLFDLSQIVKDLATDTVVVSHRASSTYDSDGILVTPTWSTVTTVKGSVQPQKEDLRREPLGERSSSLYNVYVACPLFVRDRLAVGGKTYEVESVSDWSAGGAYTQAVARLLAEGEA